MKDKEQATTALQAYMEIRRLYDDARTPQEIQAAKERQHEIQSGLSPEDNDALNKAAIDDAHAEMDKMDNWIAQAEDEKMRKTLARQGFEKNKPYLCGCQ